MSAPFVAGDRIAYRAAFLRSIVDYSAASAERRATVLDANPAGLGAPFLEIQWDDRGAPSLINVNNVLLADRRHLEPA